MPFHAESFTRGIHAFRFHYYHATTLRALSRYVIYHTLRHFHCRYHTTEYFRPLLKAATRWGDIFLFGIITYQVCAINILLFAADMHSRNNVGMHGHATLSSRLW